MSIELALLMVRAWLKKKKNGSTEDSRVPKDQLQGYHVPGIDPITKETYSEKASRLQDNTIAFGRERKVVTSPKGDDKGTRKGIPLLKH